MYKRQLAAPMTEREFAEHITELASQNKIYTSYIGMGSVSYTHLDVYKRQPMARG